MFLASYRTRHRTRTGSITCRETVGVASAAFSISPDSTKIEKEKREHAKQHGMIRTEITGAEIAEEMEKERRLFQLQMCEVGSRKPGKRFVVGSLADSRRPTAPYRRSLRSIHV